MYDGREYPPLPHSLFPEKKLWRYHEVLPLTARVAGEI